MSHMQRKLPPLSVGGPGQHPDFTDPGTTAEQASGRRKTRFSDGYSPDPPDTFGMSQRGQSGRSTTDYSSRPPSSPGPGHPLVAPGTELSKPVVYNHYPRRGRTQPGSSRPPTTRTSTAASLYPGSEPRSAWGMEPHQRGHSPPQEQLPKLPVEKSAALMVLPNTTYAQRTASPPTGGWKHWVPDLLTFDPPPPRAQSAMCALLDASLTSPSSTSPQAHSPAHGSRAHDLAQVARGDTARGRSTSLEYGAMNGDPRKAMGDVLNLWRGKRLNKAEITLEAKLNTLRQNPTARMQLEDTVRQYMDERRAVAAVLAAKAEAKEAQKEKGKGQGSLSATVKGARKPRSRAVGGSASAGGLHTMRSRQSVNIGGDAAASSTLSRQQTLRILRTFVSTTSRKWSQPPEAHELDFDAIMGPETPLSLPPEEPELPKRPLVHQVTFNEWRARRKALTEAQQQLEHEAAAKIQAAWRGFTQYRRYQKMKRSAILIQQAVRARYQPKALEERKKAAASVIVLFLQTDCKEEGGAAQLKRLRQAFLRHKRAEKNLHIVYTLRVALVARQWASVEKILIGTAKRRARSTSPTLEDLNPVPTVGGKKDKAKLMEQSLIARKKGILPGQAPEAGDDSRNLTPSAATEGVHATDRLILETLTPVPKEVKGAVIAVYLEAKLKTYFLLVGQHWKAMAKHLRTRKMAEALAAARSVVSNQAAETLDNTDRPRLPRLRILATVTELRALMQQGVAETSLFQAYILKLNLDEYEAELHAENQKMRANANLAQVVKAKKKTHAGPSRVPTAWAVSGATEPVLEEFMPDDNGGEFATVVNPTRAPLTPEQRRQARALKHSWWRDAVARAGMCMRKRWQLLQVQLIHGLRDTTHQTADEMAAFFLDHRNNPTSSIS